jgi:NAD(P)-dependent dehydrogenase (short-subunit alcohol dehydrogenase family)
MKEITEPRTLDHRTPLMKSTIYVATKHALRGLTINMAVELASEGILVNAVGPGEPTMPSTDLDRITHLWVH